VVIEAAGQRHHQGSALPRIRPLASSASTLGHAARR
jgi:hypothetical protein